MVNRCFYDEGYVCFPSLVIKRFFGSQIRTSKSVTTDHILAYIKNKISIKVPKLDTKLICDEPKFSPNNLPLLSANVDFLYYSDTGWCKRKSLYRRQDTTNTKNFIVSLYYSEHGHYLFNEITRIPFFFDPNIKKLCRVYCQGDEKLNIVRFYTYYKDKYLSINIDCTTMTLAFG